VAERVAVLAAHPDDETLGAAGAMLWHLRRGDAVHVVVATDGVTARHSESARQEECLRRAMARLGVDSVHTLSLPDQQLDAMPLLEVIGALQSVLEPIRPTVLYLHAAGDVNQDHRALHAAGLVLARPGSGVHTLRAYEVPSSSEWTPPGSLPPFVPNCFLDITEWMEEKLAAFAEYADTHESEVKPFPHPRSPEMLTAFAQRRGLALGPGRSAEAFMTLREIHSSHNTPEVSG